jgi:hypothetical protein
LEHPEEQDAEYSYHVEEFDVSLTEPEHDAENVVISDNSGIQKPFPKKSVDSYQIPIEMQEDDEEEERKKQIISFLLKDSYAKARKPTRNRIITTQSAYTI